MEFATGLGFLASCTMMGKIKVLGIAGSPREGSYNRKLLALAAKMLAVQGVEVEVFDVLEHKIPMFDPNLGAKGSLPPVVKSMREKILSADAVLFACPEYNAGYTPLMKSIIDWGSTSDPETSLKSVWKDKVGAVMSASPGAFGGVLGLVAIRQSLAHVEVLLIPQFTVVPVAHEAFKEDGSLTNERSASMLGVVLNRLVEVATKLK